MISIVDMFVMTAKSKKCLHVWCHSLTLTHTEYTKTFLFSIHPRTMAVKFQVWNWLWTTQDRRSSMLMATCFDLLDGWKKELAGKLASHLSVPWQKGIIFVPKRQQKINLSFGQTTSSSILTRLIVELWLVRTCMYRTTTTQLLLTFWATMRMR